MQAREHGTPPPLRRAAREWRAWELALVSLVVTIGIAATNVGSRGTPVDAASLLRTLAHPVWVLVWAGGLLGGLVVEHLRSRRTRRAVDPR